MFNIATLLLFSLVFALRLPAQEATLPPMPKDATPVFEVATIKPSDPADHSQGFQIRGSHMKVQNMPVTSIIMFAYGIHKKQIVDGPAWIDDRFDIDGVPDVTGEPNLKQMQNMLQHLLADRFGFKFHRTQRDLAFYAIVPAKSGPKLEPSKESPDANPDQTGNGNGAVQTMVFTNNTMDDFALGMQYFLDKPVVNKTALQGRFTFTLKWNAKLDPAADSEVPGMFTAIQEQLGLRLDATKGPVDVLSIDTLTKPTAN